MLTIWKFLLNKRPFTYLLMLGLVLYGVFSLITIRKESSPEIQIPIAVITDTLPGASPEDMEKLVTNEIEDKVHNIENIKKLTSTSREGVSVTVVEFQASADLDKSIQKVKDEVDKARGDLPRDATTPIVTDVNFADQPIMIIAVSSDLPVTQFKTLTDEVKSNLENIAGVARVEVSGVRKPEVTVIIKKDALALHGLTLTDVVSQIAANNTSLPVGTLQVNAVDYTVALKGAIEEPSEVAMLPIRTPLGSTISLSDIALVADGVEDVSSISRVSIHGAPSAQAAALSIFKQRGADITKVTAQVSDLLTKEKTGTLKDAAYYISIDAGEQITKDLTELSRTGVETVILVMIVLLLSLGWREALVSALSIPLSFTVAFIGLKESGNTINFISLFSLILAIGILVDSAIVVTEAIHTNIKKKMSKVDAAMKAITDYALPLTAGTLATVGFFVPLFTISGVTGKFISGIPFTVIFVLMASIFVALGFIPLIATLSLKQRSESDLEKNQERYANQAREWYRRWIVKMLDYRGRKHWFVWGTVALFVFSLMLPVVGLVKVQFFPEADSDFLFVEIEKPQGTPLSETDLAARAVEEVLYKDPRVESFTTIVGSGSSFDENAQSGGRFANITVNLNKDRKESSVTVVDELRKQMNTFQNFIVRVDQPSGGPPTGAPVLITFSGDNLEDLKKVAVDAKHLLLALPGTRDVTTSAENDASEFQIRIDRTKAAELGLSPIVIAQTLRTAVYGTTATTIKKQGEEIDVVTKLDLNRQFLTTHDTARATVDALRELPLATPKGTVLLGSVVTVSLGSANDVVSHEDKKRIITVSAKLQPNSNAADVSSAFAKSAKTDLKIPSGVTMKMGGENEDVDQSFQDVFRALIFAVVLVIIILVIEFNSYLHALYVISVVPLSLIGVMFGLMISGEALSFPSMLGFIALAGIIVNHTIILVDVYNRLRAEHPDMPIRTVVIEGAVLRLRPIVLTTITTIVGVIPLMFVDVFWRPIAVAILSGFTFAGVITMIFIPVLYLKWPGKVTYTIEENETGILNHKK